jgi:RNA polymerase sigma factor (sigma-70 family)
VTLRLPPDHRQEIEDCFTSMSRRVFGYLYTQTENRTLAEDLVQEVFADAAQSWSRLRLLPEDERLHWLMRVASNKCIDQRRRDQTAKQKQPLIGELYAAAEVDVFRQAITSIALMRFIEVVDSMPPSQRKVAYLRWRCGWLNHEIAEDLRITPGAVSQHLRKARQTLMNELRDFGPRAPEGDD